MESNIDPVTPRTPTPSIKPERKVPGFTPARSPHVEPTPGSEVDPGKHRPEVAPTPSPDATPSRAPMEIPPLTDPYNDQ